MRRSIRLSYRQKCEIFGLLLATVSLFILLSLATHDYTDDWILGAPPEEVPFDYQVSNAAGHVGAQVARHGLEWFGLIAWLVVGSALVWGLSLILNKKLLQTQRVLLHSMFIVLLLGMLWEIGDATKGVAWEGGAGTLSGILGRHLANGVGTAAGHWGGVLLLLGALFVYMAAITPWRPHVNTDALTQRVSDAWYRIRTRKQKNNPKSRSNAKSAKSQWNALRAKTRELLSAFGLASAPVDNPSDDDAAFNPINEQTQESIAHSVEVIPTTPTDGHIDDNGQNGKDRPPRGSLKLVRPKKSKFSGDYQYPPLDLLELPPPRVKRRSDRIEQAREALRQALQTFGITIEGGRIESYPGPVITRFEFKPGTGIKVNQISSLSDDLALAMQAQRVRIIAPIPGKSAVGIEIPNVEAEVVYLRELLTSSTFAGTSAVLPIVLGKDTQGAPFVVDLAGMPHLLIAGATGSGKSVCINSLITSLLYSHHPDELRFLFIDPKMLELSVYEGIPHLERSVVTRPKGAEGIFGIAVREMEERYRVLAGAGVRNIVDYNERATKRGESGLPFIVIVVDELADLMMSQSANNIENLITRIAQMARAVGIHLVLATQRPSVDVITGLIKANFSCRIAFQVASRIDSRTILDANGAEKLLGRGDLLFLAPGQSMPMRIHGGYITSNETDRLVTFLKEQQLETEKIANFDDDIESDGSSAGGLDSDEADPMFRHAIEVVVRHKQGSVSLLQRRLGIGYQRAARLIDKLEEAGIVGKYDGSKAREVLWGPQDLEEKITELSS